MENSTTQLLNGKRVVIVGGTSGIGLAVAKAASAQGAEVVVASRHQESVDKALAQLPQAKGYTVDVLDEAAVEDFFQTVGAFDHLVFTAGEALLLKPLAELTVKEARTFFDTRYWGALAAAKYGAARIRKGGSIVLTSGSAAVRPAPGSLTATSVTAATEAMARALAVELAPQGIRANAVRPGPVRTPLWDSSVPNADDFLAMFAKQLPVGRVAEPEELAEAYLYLMQNGFTTGTVLVVDGGHSVA